ncbi:unnamed protein product [Oppiella nova]|uniref:GAF domain-containing protein n=1 Tax=Oppiella nova TaxID=334625 RepID=A0A7R9M1P3_9ACAR|nr:unnamed protein product [Oppiella nova]CAG2169064.1 unnamed protein product [Oppiella nova]
MNIECHNNNNNITYNMSMEELENILDANPELLDDYVVKHVDLDVIENWLLRKTQNNRKRSLTKARVKSNNHHDKSKMLEELEKYLHYNEPNKINVLTQLASTVAFAVNASHWNAFIYDTISNEMKRVSEETQQIHVNGFGGKGDKKQTLVEYVYRTKRTLVWKVDDYDIRFKDGSLYMPNNTYYVMAVPILQKSDKSVLGVLELYKTKGSEPFIDEDEEEYAKTLVSADRTSLFLVDSNDKQLYAHIFEVNDNKENGDDPTITKKEIRFPIGTGIAGTVAKTGEALNIPDAYEDQRFNRDIDQLTGYKTRNLLAMPIFSKNKVIGVVQMLNKMKGNFNKVDEENFSTFATYCGLALDHARLYEKIRKSEQKNKVALEILSYHNTSNSEELERTREDVIKFKTPQVLDASPVLATVPAMPVPIGNRISFLVIVGSSPFSCQ